MPMDAAKTRRVLDIWQDYVASGRERLHNADREFTQEELDSRRRQTIPEVRVVLDRFLAGQVPIEEFKTTIDGINKRNRLWGFRGINGQMFFNMLAKNSQLGECTPRLTDELKRALPVPQATSEMSARITAFADFTRSLARYSQDQRAAPKVGSINFFLTYFWQIQDPDHIPIYYNSLVNAFSSEDIWAPSGTPHQDYISFYNLNHEISDLLASHTGQPIHLWDVEHAFWFHTQPREPVTPPTPTQPAVATNSRIPKPAPVPSSLPEELPESYLPPIVSILPALASSDPQLARLCQQAGRSIDKVFEERLAILFGMLGYEVENLGQGRGRVPDGVAVSHEFRYAIIYDAKVRQGSYTMGIDERPIREYIANTGERLRRQGIRNVYFMVVSSAFTGDHDDVIRGLKIDTDVREVILMEASGLLAMLEGRLRSPAFSLGPEGIQHLLASSGILTAADIREFFSF